MRDKTATSETEKLVASLRLKKIELEHKSIGAMLDKRTMFDLDDPEIHRKTPKSRNIYIKRENINAAADQKTSLAQVFATF